MIPPVFQVLSEQPMIAAVASLAVACIGLFGLRTKGRQDAIAQFNNAILADLDSLRGQVRAANDRLDQMSRDLQQSRLDVVQCQNDRLLLQAQVVALQSENRQLRTRLDSLERRHLGPGKERP